MDSTTANPSTSAGNTSDERRVDTTITRRQIREREFRACTMMMGGGLVMFGMYTFLDSTNWVDRQLCHTSSLTGDMWVRELINGHHSRIFNECRMSVDNFLRFCGLLRDYGHLVENNYQRVSLEETVAMVLVCLSHRSGHRQLSERFQHSLETINRQVKRGLKAIVHLGPALIRPRNDNDVHRRIRTNPRFYPWFKVLI